MRPEVWVPAVATLAAALAPIVVPAIARYFKNDPSADAPASNTARVRRLLALAAIPAAIAVFLAPQPWSWIAAGAYVAVLVAVLVWSWLRARRHPRVLPEAAKLLEAGHRPAPGFEYDRDFLPDLVRVYTKNDLAAEPGARGGGRFEETPQETTAEQRRSFDSIVLDPKVRHIAITGEAGVGKTFLLRYWEHELRHRTPSSDPVSRFRPLLVAARRLVGCSTILEAFGETSADVLTRPPGKGLTWLVMIDAFDEITEAKDRAQVERLVFEAIEDTAKHSRARKFVFTTRGLTDDRRRSFESRGVAEFELRPFTTDQLHAFFVNAETSIPDRETESPAFTAAVEKADRFLKRWEGEDDLLELLKLPLLARVAATVYFHDRHLELPSRRVDIYHDAIEHWIAQFHKRMSVEHEKHGPALRLLHKWHGAEGEPGHDTADLAIRKFLRVLASRYLAAGQPPVVGLACVLMEIQVRPKDPGELEALVTLLEATGLVHDVRTTTSHFVHKSYAEYLAAPDALASYRNPKDWNDAFLDPERRISAIFAFAQLPHDQRSALIEMMGERADCTQVLGWIAAEGLCVVKGTGRIDHELRNGLIETVFEAWPPNPNPDWWRLIRGLCTVKHARDLLFRFVEEGRRSETDRVEISSSLAIHERRGIDLLRDFAGEGNDPWIRWSAASDLSGHDLDAARETLDGLAADPSNPDYARLAALRTLAGYWPEQTVSRLIEFADDPKVSASDRVVAARALTDHDASVAEDRLRRFIDERGFEDSARVLAATWLCEFDRDAGTAVLRAIASTRAMNPNLRTSAAEGLADYDRESGVALLWELARDRFATNVTRIWILSKLRELDPEPARRELEGLMADRSLDAVNRMVVARLRAEDGDPVDTAMLESIASDPSVSDGDQVYAIDEMLRAGRERMTDRLRRYATDPSIDGHARVSAAFYLSRYDFRSAIPLLEDIANDPISDLAREHALSTLMRAGHPTARRRLLDLAEDPHAPGAARIEAVRSLMPRLGEQGLTILRALRSDQRLQPEDRAEVLVSLIEFDESEATDQLAELADDPEALEDARIKAASALARYDLSHAVVSLRRISESEEVSDNGRASAARELIRFDPDHAVSFLSDLASGTDIDDKARVNAAKHVAEVDRETGRSLLLPLAQETGLCRSFTVEAAYWLYKSGDDRGKALLTAYATGRELDDQARVEAARRLLELDRVRGTELLTEFASDLGLDSRAQTDAALALARVDREAGLSALRDIAEGPPTLDGRVACAAAGIAKLQPTEGKRLLHALAANENDRGLTRVIAADELAERDRSTGLPILRDLAEGDSLEPFAREVAARRFVEFERVIGGELVSQMIEDRSVPAQARAEAAEDVPVENFSEFITLQRRFADDPEFGGLGRVSVALTISYEKKREGLDRLRALADDPGLDETERCWAEVNLALRDVGARASLEDRRFDPNAVDFARLKAVADELIRLDLRSGHWFRRRIEALESFAGVGLVHE
ncbi:MULTISPECIES: NACHT domain-containing protein [Glycomyces]|uniref:NACHT domain-containing protein n=2 Tax=Glycomyces TaxID=58113 RepID=A0A9X3PMV5_9ACTN|nr:NACHT domain-containing protein [Glycomyces lechevalierae]MDA1386681.1 NACHT domain-containing protein [Glycomyces lechevalierae]MDR7340328.1 hypothetical protein [Glycomyces lechevalierae]